MNIKTNSRNLFLIAITFALTLNFTVSGETQSPSGDVAAFANAWSFEVNRDKQGRRQWNVYASASSYADSTEHGAGNKGNLSVSAFAYMEGDANSFEFENGGSDSMSFGGDHLFQASASASANVTSVLGSDSASQHAPDPNN
ncbi:hypothetical protein F4141_05695 [Candidatus Poribacteria bacterium]|nr:hypothetical protein [Candidatus Poribacteria bacterium]